MIVVSFSGLYYFLVGSVPHGTSSPLRTDVLCLLSGVSWHGWGEGMYQKDIWAHALPDSIAEQFLVESYKSVAQPVFGVDC